MIEVKHLTKLYGRHKALSDLSFCIEKGGIYGLLGPNGAGKSTTMNIMTGCLAATSGEVKIGGYDIFEDAFKAKKLIGYLPEQPPLYMDRTPREYLTFVAGAKQIPDKDIAKRIDDVMETTGINHVADRLIKVLSKGYRQRVGIAQAILGDPEIVILDEPTVGLDPKQIIEIRDLIKDLGRNHTVIFSSHILSEVQQVCQTVMIISGGELAACDTPENLEKLFAGTSAVEVIAEADEEEARRILSGLGRNHEIRCNAIADQAKTGQNPKCNIQIETDKACEEDLCREIFNAFAEAKRPILRLNTTQASLEDIFIELTKEENADESHVQA